MQQQQQQQQNCVDDGLCIEIALKQRRQTFSICCLTVQMRRKYPKGSSTRIHSWFDSFFSLFRSVQQLISHSLRIVFSGRRFIFHRGSDFYRIFVFYESAFLMIMLDRTLTQPTHQIGNAISELSFRPKNADN